MAAPGMVEIVAVTIFAIALLHTFSAHYFQALAHAQPNHAGLWHLLGEVEVVFGFWAAVLLVFLVTHSGTGHALHYLESRNFTEPAFVFVIMVIAASRPIIDLAGALLHVISRALPLERPVAYYFTLMSVGPLLGSLITEPGMSDASCTTVLTSTTGARRRANISMYAFDTPSTRTCSNASPLRTRPTRASSRAVDSSM